MTVHIVARSGLAVTPPTGAKSFTLFGNPFPPDDVKAYWSLVPELIVAEWSIVFEVFFVRKLTPVPPVHDDDDVQPVKRLQVFAQDAHKLEVWMKVCSELING